MSKRNAQTYEAIFTAIAEQSSTVFGVDLVPHTIITDFEAAAIAAFRTVFPSAVLCTWPFHFSQSILRHVQSEGLTRKYMEDKTVYVGVKMLIALAFVPVEDVGPMRHLRAVGAGCAAGVKFPLRVFRQHLRSW